VFQQQLWLGANATAIHVNTFFASQQSRGWIQNKEDYYGSHKAASADLLLLELGCCCHLPGADRVFTSDN
jgi:hypothetical protein